MVGITSLGDARKIWNSISQRSITSADALNPAIGLVGSFTLEPIVPFLGAELFNLTGHGYRIAIAPFDQVFQTCIDWKKSFPEEPDLTCLCFIWRVEDLARLAIQGLARNQSDATADAIGMIRELLESFKRLRVTFSGTLIFSLPPFPHFSDHDIHSIQSQTTVGRLHRTIVDLCVAELAELEDVLLLDLDGLQRFCGISNVQDNRKWYLYRQPFREEFCSVIGKRIGALIASEKKARKKCLIVDCDNTLWGGILGEDGIGGIALGDSFPGSAFRDFQSQLVSLHAQGVMIALCSKNEEADVWQVFQEHAGMAITRNQIVAHRINWSDKAANIESIADELNISLDSIVFIDDSSYELECVELAFPMVTCIQVPTDVAFLPSLLGSKRFFDQKKVGREDASRTNMMAQERERREFSRSVKMEEFLRSLNLSVEVGELSGEQVSRVAQLVNKTNQFNLTNVRRSEKEVAALITSPEWHVIVASAADRFGEYGLIGVAVLHAVERGVEVDTLVLSCRALGRGVEDVILAAIFEEAQCCGKEFVRGRFIFTERNRCASSFYHDRGFVSSGDGCWYRQVFDGFSWPSHIRRKLAQTASI
jgi:FkbH-like protein